MSKRDKAALLTLAIVAGGVFIMLPFAWLAGKVSPWSDPLALVIVLVGIGVVILFAHGLIKMATGD